MVFIRMFTGQFLAGCPAKQELKSSFTTIKESTNFSGEGYAPDSFTAN